MLYRKMLDGIEQIRVPQVWPELSTNRLLTLDWLEGRRLLEHVNTDLATRNRLGTAMFMAWWWSFSRFGVIHGDPHLGNYSVFDVDGLPTGINLLDYGCIRIFPSKFVGGVVDLYHGLLKNDDALIVHAYETWGFKRLSRELIDVLNIWARFIYGRLGDAGLHALRPLHVRGRLERGSGAPRRHLRRSPRDQGLCASGLLCGLAAMIDLATYGHDRRRTTTTT